MAQSQGLISFDCVNTNPIMQPKVTNYHHRDAVGAGRFILAQLTYVSVIKPYGYLLALIAPLRAKPTPPAPPLYQFGACMMYTHAFARIGPRKVQLNQTTACVIHWCQIKDYHFNP